jgi:hypothetical protein
MIEHPNTIRGNIKHYERLLKVDSPSYTHKSVRSLLAESKARLATAIADTSEVPLSVDRGLKLHAARGESPLPIPSADRPE